jgi:hypothetical protein
VSTPSNSSSERENLDTTPPEEAAQPPLEEGTDLGTTPTPAQSSSTHPMTTLPPEAQGETNGGPLGCCLGVVIGLLLSVSIALLSRFYADPLYKALNSNLSLVVRSLMVLVALLAMIVFGYLGWRIGKAIFREYEQPLPLPKQRHRKRARTAAQPRP